MTIKIVMPLIPKNVKNIFLVDFLKKLSALTIDRPSQSFFAEEKMRAISLLK